MTTFQEFMESLATLYVPGVKTRLGLGETPEGITSVKLPVQFVDMPTARTNPLVLDSSQWWPTYSAVVTILVAPVGQSRWSTVMGQVIQFMDAVREALQEWAQNHHPGAAVSVTVNRSMMDISGVSYWAVDAEVEFTGE